MLCTLSSITLDVKVLTWNDKESHVLFEMSYEWFNHYAP